MVYICLQTWAPVRKDPTSVSEMVSSLIFGETCTLLETHNDWKKIRCDYDGYIGWIAENYLNVYDFNLQFNRLLSSQGATLVSDEGRIHLSAGSNLPQGDRFELFGEFWELHLREKAKSESIWETALGFSHVPYLWGGRSDCGIDCSGLTQIVCKIHGIAIPRDAWQQANYGVYVGFDERSPGDLAFFKNHEGKITHTGIIAPNGIIHAHGKVRLDELHSSGIWNVALQKYTHVLHSIKRFK